MMNEISIYLEAVGFTWPRDDPKQMTLALSQDNSFEEIYQFLQEENIEQEFVFSQDKAGTQRISNLKTTLKVLKIADNGIIYVLLKSNLDKEPQQPERKPIQKIQINNKPQQQEPPQEQVPLKFVELDKQQNEFIVNIELNGKVVQIGLGMRGRHGSKIQNIIDQLLMEGIIKNSPYSATLKEENGKDISNDPKYVLQEPQIKNKGRYILSIKQDDVPQEKQPIRDSQGNILPQDRQEAYYKEVERQKILQAEMERQDRIRNQKLKEDLKGLHQLIKEEQDKNPQDNSAEEAQRQETLRQQEQAKKQEEIRQQELIKQQEAQKIEQQRQEQLRQEQQRQEQQRQEQQRQEQQRQEQQRQEQLRQELQRQEQLRLQEEAKQLEAKRQDEARRQEELRQQELIKQAKFEQLRIQEEARKQEEARIQEEARQLEYARKQEEAKQQELLKQQEVIRQEAQRLEAIRLENIRLEQEAIRQEQIKQQQQINQQQKLNQKFAMPPVKNDKQIEDTSEWSEFIPLSQQTRALSQATYSQQDQGSAYKKYNSSDQSSIQQDLSSFDRLTSSVISQQDTMIQIKMTALNFKFKGSKQDFKCRTKITKTIEEFIKSLYNNQTIPQLNVILHLSKCGKNVLNKSRTFNSYSIDESWVIFASLSEEQEEEIEIV